MFDEWWHLRINEQIIVYDTLVLFAEIEQIYRDLQDNPCPPSEEELYAESEDEEEEEEGENRENSENGESKFKERAKVCVFWLDIILLEFTTNRYIYVSGKFDYCITITIINQYSCSFVVLDSVFVIQF